MNHGLQKKIYYHSKSETSQLIIIIIINYIMIHAIPIIITINANNNMRAIPFFGFVTIIYDFNSKERL